MTDAGREAAETLEIISEISGLLNTGLDRETLSILTSLCEMGVNPEALAAVVRELRRESDAIKVRMVYTRWNMHDGRGPLGRNAILTTPGMVRGTALRIWLIRVIATTATRTPY